MSAMHLTGSARQAQKQTLSPAMFLGLNLLTLPIGELKEAIKKEIDSNPALEFSTPTTARANSPAAADYLENVADAAGEGLDEHLLSELRMSGVAGRELDLCRAIVAEIDRDGRFKGEMPTIQMVTGATAEELENARRKVMDIDPKGCGARDLGECYLAQIGQIPAAKREKARAAIEAVVAVLEGRASPSGVDPEAVALLRKLDAYPGRQYDYRRTDYVVPDIRVDEDGEVSVDQSDIPELRVSPKYVEMAKDRELDEETRQFAAERVRRAREFREAVARRQETMEKVAELSISGQADFLKVGAAGLHRQTMQDVARKAKCSVATVSRAAARKYVKTPRGTVPLRRFFSLVEQEPIEKLRELLAEGGGRSDRELSELMAKDGFKMARRTVAKYRARLNG